MHFDTSDTPLGLGLEQRGELLAGERALLARPDVRALPEHEQLAFLAQNRRAGYYVTLFAGGVRLLALAGGGVALEAYWFSLMTGGGRAAEWERFGVPLVGLAMLGASAWFARGWYLRLRELRRVIGRP